MQSNQSTSSAPHHWRQSKQFSYKTISSKAWIRPRNKSMFRNDCSRAVLCLPLSWLWTSAGWIWNIQVTMTLKCWLSTLTWGFMWRLFYVFDWPGQLHELKVSLLAASTAISWHCQWLKFKIKQFKTQASQLWVFFLSDHLHLNWFWATEGDRWDVVESSLAFTVKWWLQF